MRRHPLLCRGCSLNHAAAVGAAFGAGGLKKAESFFMPAVSFARAAALVSARTSAARLLVIAFGSSCGMESATQ